MKQHMLVIVTIVNFILGLVPVQAQVEGLAVACNTDMALISYLGSQIGSGQNAATGTLTSDEIEEVQSVLIDSSVEDASDQEKYSAVMIACSEGRILTSRFLQSTN